MEFLLPLLGGALGAAIINGVFAFFKLRHDKRVEHDQWLRDHQLTSYAGLVDSTKTAAQWVSSAYKVDSWKARNDEGLAIMASLKTGQLVMSAPSATLTAADDMISSLYDMAEQVSIHGHAPDTPQFAALNKVFAEKQQIFNRRCRADFRAPK